MSISPSATEKQSDQALTGPGGGILTSWVKPAAPLVGRVRPALMDQPDRLDRLVQPAPRGQRVAAVARPAFR